MKAIKIFLTILILSASIIGRAQTPSMNAEIVKYVKSVIGTKVGRGECWDLAHDALTLVNAQWDHQYNYGKEINPSKDSIYPGDIIHFSNVVVKYTTEKGTFTESYPQHTAIVYRVLAPGEYQIAHQNNGYSGKKVGLSNLRLADKKSGKIQFYRPVAE
jgi:hypothetical protein